VSLAKRLHSVGPGKLHRRDDEPSRDEAGIDDASLDETALTGPDAPPPRKLTPEWVAVNLMDITAHLMAAIDKAAGPLDRLADAAEDATAHVAHASRFFRKPLTIAVMAMLVGIAAFSVYFVEARPHHYSDEAGAYATDNSHVSLGGVLYALDRKQFEARLAGAQPEAIRKYYVEIGGRKFPVKQAVSVGLGAPRASFRSDAAIHALTKMGYQTRELAP
jgi:hypothetical protein